jgi:hypothetical protein
MIPEQKPRSRCGDAITVVTRTEHEHVRFARAAKGRLCSWMVRVAAVIRCVPSLGTVEQSRVPSYLATGHGVMHNFSCAFELPSLDNPLSDLRRIICWGRYFSPRWRRNRASLHTIRDHLSVGMNNPPSCRVGSYWNVPHGVAGIVDK